MRSISSAPPPVHLTPAAVTAKFIAGLFPKHGIAPLRTGALWLPPDEPVPSGDAIGALLVEALGLPLADAHAKIVELADFGREKWLAGFYGRDEAFFGGIDDGFASSKYFVYSRYFQGYSARDYKAGLAVGRAVLRELAKQKPPAPLEYQI